MQSAIPPTPTPVALIALMWIAWVIVIFVADFLAFMMFAFADSPGGADAAKRMIVPIFIWFAITFVAGIVLLASRGAWQIALAFVLAISPPFVVFLGYNLLGADATRANPNTPPAPPATQAPPGQFRPSPTSLPVQPDFQKTIRDAQRSATTSSSEG